MILIALTPPAVAEGVVVELLPYVESERNELFLGDIASFHGDHGDSEKLGKIKLPMRGKVGDSFQFKRDSIAKYIALKRPDASKNLRVEGAEKVVINRKGESLAASEFISAAKFALDENLAKTDKKITTELDGNYQDVPVPKGARKLEARASSVDIKAKMRVWVEIAVDGQHYTSIPVAFKVKWPRGALVMNRIAVSKSFITPDMLSAVQLNAAETNGTLITAYEQIQGKRLRHEMNAGAVLRAEDLEEKPSISLGDEVAVIAQVGGVVVQTKARAETDGFIGQLINVHMAKTREKLLVEVIGEGRAIVGEKIHK